MGIRAWKRRFRRMAEARLRSAAAPPGLRVPAARQGTGLWSEAREVKANDPVPALYAICSEFDPVEVVLRHAVDGQRPENGFILNFLGTRIVADVFPPILSPMVGTVEPAPNPGNWHADIAEWASGLRAVDMSGEVFRIVELGCGWGCWMSNMGVAARRTGRKVDLIGVEGVGSHLANAVKVLEMNGFAKDEYRLVHGVAGPEPGKAIFPDPEVGTAEWGGEAIFYPDEETLAAASRDPGVRILDCYTLEMLSGGKPVDLLHIDIQGAEADFVRANLSQMNRFVRRVLIGTHGRAIEADLLGLFQDAGWRMETDRPAFAPLQRGRPVLHIDGVQLWANDALDPG